MSRSDLPLAPSWEEGGLCCAMARDDLKKRIEALNKKPLKNVPDAESPEMRGLRRKIKKQAAVPPSTTGAAPKQARATASSERPERIVYSRMPQASSGNKQKPAPGEPVRLEEVIEGQTAEAPAGPGYYLIEMPARDLESESAFVHRRFVSLTGHPDGEAVEQIAHTCKRKRLAPEEIMFLDLETTGLGTTPIFLVGTMECSNDGFHFRQYFARDYSEEISILSAINHRMRDSRMLVTFNGKSFDEPYLRNRAVATGLEMNTPRAHLDLLHEARKRYRRELPNCKLQTLEQMICGRYREDDIPGSEIPAAYHEFVRTGDACKIQLILQHNLYDLLTMADLMNRLWYCE